MSSQSPQPTIEARIQALAAAVAGRDAPTAVSLLSDLDGVEIDPLGEAHDRLWNLQAALVTVLFEGLAPAEFGRRVATSRYLYNPRAWQTLESMAPRLSAGFLWALRAHLGLPDPHDCPALYATLATAGGEDFSRRLADTVEALAAAAPDPGASPRENPLSGFRHLRLADDDGGLVDAVRLLAARGDRSARAACRRYLLALPWGPAGSATGVLLAGIRAWPAAWREPLLREALARHDGPLALRIGLWRALAGDDPVGALTGLLGDLERAEDDTGRLLIIQNLAATLSALGSGNGAVDLTPVAALAERVATGHWPRLLRGYYGAVLRAHLPTADARRVSRRWERGAMVLIDAWERVRLEHMGCLVPLMLMLVGGKLVNVGLDRLLGEPAWAGWLPPVLFSAWIGWALVTVETHFSRPWSLAGKLGAGAVYFGLLLGALLTAVLVRIF